MSLLCRARDTVHELQLGIKGNKQYRKKNKDGKKRKQIEVQQRLQATPHAN